MYPRGCLAFAQEARIETPSVPSSSNPCPIRLASHPVRVCRNYQVSGLIHRRLGAC
jgi:hypothetical protein